MKLLLLALLLSSCTSTYYAARFGPASSEVMVTPPERPGAAARVLVSVIGVRKAEAKTETPAQTEIRLRVENLGQTPVRLEQHSLELLSGELEPFGAARLVSDQPPVVAPGGASNFDLFFPMPGDKSPDDVSFRSLDLRFTLDFDGQAVTSSVHFERAVSAYDPYGPYWHEPRVSIGVGFISTH